MLRRMTGLLSMLMLTGLLTLGCAGQPQPAPQQPAPQQPAPPAQTEPEITAADARKKLEAHLDELVRLGQSNPKLFQFAIGEAVPEGRGFKFRTVQTYRQPNQPFSGVMIHSYAVDAAHPPGVARISFGEAREEKGVLVLDLEGPTAKPVVKLADLPKVFTPYGAQPGTEFGVGKDGFSVLALHPEFKSVAFVTRGLHPFFGIADAETGKVRGLDLFFEGGASELAWSHDGKYLAVAVLRPSGGEELQVWDAAAGKRVEIKDLPKGTPEAKAGNLRWKGKFLFAEINGQTWGVDPVAATVAKP